MLVPGENRTPELARGKMAQKPTKKTKIKRKGTAKKNKPKKTWFTPEVKKWPAKVDNN
jgi:hypothetical protein